MKLIVDSHLDLAMNAVLRNRDLTKTVATTRSLEAGLEGKGRGCGTVALPEMRQGKVGLCFATVVARASKDWVKDNGIDASSQDIAFARAGGQLTYYRLLERFGELRQIRNVADLESHLKEWEEDQIGSPVGYVFVMEGADPIVEPDLLGWWWDEGLRMVSLSHYGVSNYAHGTGTVGGLLPQAFKLLHKMQAMGMALDLTHLADKAFWEALDAFEGHVLASHQCCRTLVPGSRQMSDEQLVEIISRDGVVGTALDAWMLYPDWIIGETDPALVSLEDVVNHIEHVCDIAGNCHHAALGTDLDGGFGKEQTPHDLETIEELGKIGTILSARGFTDDDISAILRDNWIRFLRKSLPAE
jgi:membrane dipeptidase